LRLQQWPVYSTQDQVLGALFVIRDETEQQALAQMRDDLLQMLVHDMRNPLTVLLSALQILQDPVMREMSEEIIEIGITNTNRLLRLVNAILDIGKLESGRFELHQEAMTLHGRFADLVKAVAEPGKQFALELHLPDNLPPVWGDPPVIDRILENVLGNAMKFIPATAGCIRITVTAAEGWETVEIFNNGPHIPPAVFKRLFQKFAAGDYKQRGYGLGLAFCRLAIEAHGGKIWAENQPDGVAFFLTLPMLALQDFVYPMV